MNDAFFSGANCVAALAVSMFFLRFWLRTRDPLFIFFCTAFALMAVERIILARIPMNSQEALWAHLIRLLAFALIIAAVVHKNWKSRRQ